MAEELQLISPQPGPQMLLLSCPCSEVFFGGARGGGKAALLTSKLLTPTGWKLMGQIQLGDELMCPTGGTEKVLGIYPQGEQETFKLTFIDKASTVTSADHLWLARRTGTRRKAGQLEYKLWTTGQMAKFLEEQAKVPPSSSIKNLTLHIPLCQPIDFPQSTLPIHPYLVGVLLGDGCPSQGGVIYSSVDREIAEKLEQLGYKVTKLKEPTGWSLSAQGLAEKLRELGLVGHKAKTKFIPAGYKVASLVDRVQLMQGLMDTDGAVDSTGKALYYGTTSYQLALDVQELTRSLGGKATISVRQTTYTYHGEKKNGLPSYVVYLQTPINSQLVSLPRKLKRVRRKFNGNGQELSRRLISIEPAGFAPVQCIRVDHPAGLYLTDDYLVTHNTFGVLLDWAAHAMAHGGKASGILFRRSMPEFEDILEKSKRIYPQLDWEYKPTERVWVSAEGARLRLRYLDRDADADNYQGHEYTWMGFDELPNWPNPVPINKLRACLRSPQGVPVRLVATGNPGGVGHAWVKERYIDAAPPLSPFTDNVTGAQVVFIPSHVQDNKLLMANDPEYINRLKGTGPSWLVKAWLDGDWVVSREGNIFKRSYFKEFIEPPEFFFIMQSWDTAFKTKEINSRSACLTVGAATTGYYLINGWAGHVEFPDLKKKVIDIAVSWQPHEIVIEDKASGQSLFQELRRNTSLPIHREQVDGDKVARANAITPLCEAERIFIPSEKSRFYGAWVPDFVDEVCAFPISEQDRNGRVTKIYHDDYVDCFTQGIGRLSRKPHLISRMIAALYPSQPIRSVQIFSR